MTTRPLVIKCTTISPEPATQAFNVAAVALASGSVVSVWLTGDAVGLGMPGGAEAVVLEHSAALHELRDAVLAGGTLTVCAQCALRRGLGQEDLLPDVRIAGAAAFVAEILAPDAQALVY